MFCTKRGGLHRVQWTAVFPFKCLARFTCVITPPGCGTALRAARCRAAQHSTHDLVYSELEHATRALLVRGRWRVAPQRHHH